MISTPHQPLHPKSSAVNQLDALLRQSISVRVQNVPEPPIQHSRDSHSLKRAKIAVLFSGGLDCTVLARTSHDLLPTGEPIDLINVAFQNPRIHKEVDDNKESASIYEMCPDRITGRASYAELQVTCPEREWRFVAVNIPYTETSEHRQKVISLMHPHNTEMDLSISLALYFAARGQGVIRNTLDGRDMPYTTSARVLLSGLGADELFGGYTRHATAYRHGGTTALLDELELDVARLGQRNLGRDDRVMSHWGREVRFPYLDEALLDWALNAPVADKCGFGETELDLSTAPKDEEESTSLEPGKKVLRCLAWRLGMRGVATEKKRAVLTAFDFLPAFGSSLMKWQIQFGARTAKMENRKTKGTQLLS
jgi:asparagine synthetase B (glutamine-hydrolysing)